VLIVPTSTLQTVTAGPSSPSGHPSGDLLEMYRRMLVIRGFEERVSALYRDGEVPGFVHLSIGQEAAAVGACWPLRLSDVITSTHRGHGHCLAKGLDPLGMFAELMGKDQGTNRGRGGSMHIADPTLGIFGANGIVAAGVPIAVGAATASQLRADGGVAVAFFGDGAPAQGAFHEAMNLAAVWQLPVVFFCENNGYAEFSPASTQHGAPLERRAEGYGMPYIAVDGNDVLATAAAMETVVDAVRAGGGPAVIEAATFRWHGHYEGDPERYRSAEEVQEWKARDPLLVHEARLRAVGAGDDDRLVGYRGLDLAHRLDAVDAGHGDVHEDHGRVLAEGDLHRLEAVDRDQYVVTRLLEHPAAQALGHVVVVRHQHRDGLLAAGDSRVTHAVSAVAMCSPRPVEG